MAKNKLKKTYNYLAKRLKGMEPEAVIILGSGLSGILADADSIKKIPYTKIPHVPKPTVSGHQGILDIVRYQKKIVAVMRGRFHVYEGNHPDDTVRLLRALILCGIKSAILTNAAGSTSTRHKPGELMLLKDHINVTALTPLSSDEARSMGPTFVDVSEPYSIKLRNKIKAAAKKNRVKINEGVYAWMTGPQYETAAEVRMLNKNGADAVGMSTVAEVLALRQMDVQTACISTITNYGTGVIKGKKLSHDEVKTAAKKVQSSLDKILKATIASL